MLEIFLKPFIFIIDCIMYVINSFSHIMWKYAPYHNMRMSHMVRIDWFYILILLLLFLMFLWLLCGNGCNFLMGSTFFLNLCWLLCGNNCNFLTSLILFILAIVLVKTIQWIFEKNKNLT